MAARCDGSPKRKKKGGKEHQLIGPKMRDRHSIGKKVRSEHGSRPSFFISSLPHANPPHITKVTEPLARDEMAKEPNDRAV